MTHRSHRLIGLMRRAPWGMLGALVLGWCIEGAIDKQAIDFRSAMQWDWLIMRRSVEKNRSACDLWILGDSLAKEGLLPEILEAKTGLSTRQMAINAGSVPAHYYLLQEAALHRVRPRAMVLELEPHLLHCGFSFGRANWPVFLKASEAAELAWAQRDADFLTGWAMARLLPSVRGREEIRSFVRSRLVGETPALRNFTTDLLANWRKHDGAQIFPASVQFDGQLTADHHLWFPEAWSLEPASEAYFEPFLNLLESMDARIYWLLPPISKAASERRRAIGMEQQFEALVRSRVQGHPGWTILDARSLDLPNQCFHDPFHLNETGARILSHRVAEAIAREGPSSTWLVLEPRPIGNEALGVPDAQVVHADGPREEFQRE